MLKIKGSPEILGERQSIAQKGVRPKFATRK